MLSRDGSLITSRKQALAFGQAHGQDDALSCVQEAEAGNAPADNPSGWQDWGTHSSEAASLLRVPARWQWPFMTAYEKAARKVVAQAIAQARAEAA